MIDNSWDERQELRNDLAKLAKRYAEHHGDDLEGLSALGENLLQLADHPKVNTSWLSLIYNLNCLSG